jgi:hypothetical protein
MALDRYTKLVLTVIAVCLVWISVGGPSLITPVRAQGGDRVILAGWVDERGAVVSFPKTPALYDPDTGRLFDPERSRPAWSLPVTTR